MEYIDEYRDPDRIQQLVDHIAKTSRKPIKLMEVCGTHTVTIFRNGIKDLLPHHITLISGPGCPVCVTPVEGIDRSLALAQEEEVIIATFGDLLRVPGSETSLAQQNRSRQVVFLGIGFETTAPTIAAVIQRAREARIGNFTVLSMHKVLPPALKSLVQSPELEINGFICPGHVSTIIGSRPYMPLAHDFGIPCVIAGFEPLDVLQAIGLLVRQIENDQAKVEIQYRRAVSPGGNPKARALMEEVFEPCDSIWRGFGSLPGSGLNITSRYGDFDAERRFDLSPVKGREPAGCICGDILRGLKRPPDCSLFQSVCTPENPVGACMVSSEGTCGAYYKYST
jgi:hydrogenase expression/formation protein HypD